MYQELILLFALGLPLAVTVYALNVPLFPESRQKRHKRTNNRKILFFRDRLRDRSDRNTPETEVVAT